MGTRLNHRTARNTYPLQRIDADGVASCQLVKCTLRETHPHRHTYTLPSYNSWTTVSNTYPLHQIDACCAAGCQLVKWRVRLDKESHVGDVNAHLIQT